MPARLAFWFLRYLTRDHVQFGFQKSPEHFPKQAGLLPGRFGNWLRVPGRHHTREHWSRVWDGGRWLEGADAVDFILALGGDPPSLIPEEPNAPTFVDGGAMETREEVLND